MLTCSCQTDLQSSFGDVFPIEHDAVSSKHHAAWLALRAAKLSSDWAECNALLPGG